MANRINQQKHDKLVGQIADIRFPFPSPGQPIWLTYINHPEKSMGIVDRYGNVLYPDIVVVNTNTNSAVMAGEVETEDSVNPEEAGQWRDYSSSITPFFLCN